MADDIFSQLTEADLDAYLNDDFESMSDAGLDSILSYRVEGAAETEPPSQPAAPVPPAAPNSRFMTQGFGSAPQPGSGDAAAAGFERMGQRLYNGYKQLTSDNVADEKQWADLEQKQRDQFAAIDEGLGAEDTPAIALGIGSLFVPGGQVRAMKTGMGLLQTLTARTGGIAFVSALHELVTGKTEEENRLAESAKTGALVYGGGKLGGFAVKRAEKLAKAVGATAIVTKMGGSMRDRFFGRFGTWMARHLDGGTPGGLPREARSVMANAHRSGNAALLKGTAMNAKADADAYVPGQQEWDEYMDLVQAFGKQGNTKTTKAMGINRREEAQVIAQNLLTGTSRRGPNGEVTIDAEKILTRWQNLSSQPQFRQIFGTTNAKGTFTLHKAGRQLDEFVQKVARIGPKPGRPGDKVIELAEVFDDRRDEVVEKMIAANQEKLVPKYLANRRERVAAIVSSYAADNDMSPADLYDVIMGEDMFAAMEVLDKLSTSISERSGE